MKIDLLRVKNLRNLEDVEIYPGPRFNFFFGRNGAGKTSIMEAIYLLGRGRTYRGVSAGPVISEGRDAVEVFARAVREEGEARSIGVWKNKKETRIKLDGAYVNRLSELARRVPLQMIATQSHDLFLKGPGVRRRFLDWGLFHVEHNYQAWFSRYKRILEQRNALLKQGGGDTHIWDEQLKENGQRVHEIREQYIGELIPVFKGLVNSFFHREDLTVEYYPGWRVQDDYLRTLRASLSADLKKGFTGVGIHKADLRVKIGKEGAESIVSRGQQKILVSSLLVAQAILLKQKTGDTPVILFDDVSAELDKENLRRLLNLLFEQEFQVYLNSTENILEGTLPEIFSDSRMFHVEHGRVTPAS